MQIIFTKKKETSIFDFKVQTRIILLTENMRKTELLLLLQKLLTEYTHSVVNYLTKT